MGVRVRGGGGGTGASSGLAFESRWSSESLLRNSNNQIDMHLREGCLRGIRGQHIEDCSIKHEKICSDKTDVKINLGLR